MTDQIIVEEVIADLERMQKFKPALLVRREDLGANAFVEAVEPATRLVELFKRLPTDIVSELPFQQKSNIQQWSKSAYNLFEQILKFDLDQGNNTQRKDALVQKLTEAYQDYFNHLSPLISYSVARTVDFNRLSEEGRLAVQSIHDKTEPLIKEITNASESAKSLLNEVREIAAEQGVSQQAEYFKREADGHKTQADIWKFWTLWSAAAVGIYGIVAIFLHKWSWLAPETTIEAIQFMASKLVVFFILVFLLVLCARNFMSNRHNEIVNRHRQNALLTFKVLVESGVTPEARDIVLNHAASAIYKLHETGYSKSGDSGVNNTSIVEMIPKTSFNSGGG